MRTEREADEQARHDLAVQVAYRHELGQELRRQDNVWRAAEVLTEALGREVGRRLEQLLCKLVVDVKAGRE